MLPDEKMLAAMGKYNEELAKAGVLLDFVPSNRPRRGRAFGFPATSVKVIDGPFVETKELIAGYWISPDEISRGVLSNG